MPTKLAAIIGNTFTETIRQPIFSVLTWVAAALLAINPTLAAYSLDIGHDNKIMKDVGLATLLLYGLLASVFSATSAITREIESFTVLTVVSKPIGRPLFLVGKYLGVMGAVLLGYYLLCLVFLMTCRHGPMETASQKLDYPVLVLSTLALVISLIAATFGNYVYGWHFPTTLLAWVVPLGTVAFAVVLGVGKEWKPQPVTTDFGDLQVVYAITMVFCAVWILTAFAVALATRFSQVMTLLLCAVVFMLGLLSDYYFAPTPNTAAPFLHQVLYAVLPNFQFFWVGDALTQEMMVPGVQVARVAGYAACYSAAIVGLGVVLFQTREVG